MSKSRSFSIFLLKQEYDASNALKDDHSLEQTVPATALPKNASLFILDNAPKEPWWKSYFGVQMSLQQVTKGALIFLPVDTRVFALSFGHVAHNLKDVSYEPDFGLRVTLNCVDPAKIKNTDILEPCVSRRQRTQVSVDSNITYFDFDRNSTILKSLTGKVKKEYQEIMRHATGASSLRISSAASSDELIRLCEKLLELYESDEYKTTFPDIQNITPVRDPEIIKKLNETLLYAFVEKQIGISLTIPEIIEYRDNIYTTFSGVGESRVYDGLSIEDYYNYIEFNGKDLATLGIEDLKKHTLYLTDENGFPRDSHSIFKSLIFECSTGDEDATYHLIDGNWYKAENAYIDKLRAFLDPLCIDLPYPDYLHEDEGDYNKAFAAEKPAYLCFDKTDISPAGQTQIEPCDLYHVRDSRAMLIHVKRSTLSAQLSHLFNQGANAVELLKLEKAAVEQILSLIDKAAGALAAPFKAPIEASNPAFEVVFGIVTGKDKSRRSANLPLFSRISLMRNIKALQLMNAKANFGFIPDKTPKTEGKKKPRKKAAAGDKE